MIWKTIAGKPITEEIVRELVANGRTRGARRASARARGARSGRCSCSIRRPSSAVTLEFKPRRGAREQAGLEDHREHDPEGQRADGEGGRGPSPSRAPTRTYPAREHQERGGEADSRGHRSDRVAARRGTRTQIRRPAMHGRDAVDRRVAPTPPWALLQATSCHVSLGPNAARFAASPDGVSARVSPRNLPKPSARRYPPRVASRDERRGSMWAPTSGPGCPSCRRTSGGSPPGCSSTCPRRPSRRPTRWRARSASARRPSSASASKLGFGGFAGLHDAIAEGAMAPASRARGAAPERRGRRARPLADGGERRPDRDAEVACRRAARGRSAELLRSRRGRTYVFGQRKSAALAEYAFFLLNPLIPHVAADRGGAGERRGPLIDVGPDDRLLAFTFRPYARLPRT